jgi:hypothetical protein
LPSAQILQFPAREREERDPSSALATIVRSLTNQQSVALGREISVLSATIAREVAAAPTSTPQAIRPRHSERCASKRSGRACDCDPAREVWVWSSYDKKKIRKTLPTRQAAIKCRRKHLGLAKSGGLRAPMRITLAEAAYTWLGKARAGEILNRSGRRYKPTRAAHPGERLPAAAHPRDRDALHERHRTRRPACPRHGLAGAVQREQGPRLRQRIASALARPQPDHRQQQRAAGQSDGGSPSARGPATGSRPPRKRTGSSRRWRSATRHYGQPRCTPGSDSASCEPYASKRSSLPSSGSRSTPAGTNTRAKSIQDRAGRRTTVVIELLETILVGHLEQTGRSG